MIRKRISRIEDRLYCKYDDHTALVYIAGVPIRFQIDSGSAVTLVPKCKIAEILKNSREETLRVKWEDISSEYECYNDEVINLVGRIHATIRFGDWKTPPKDLYIGERNLAILGRDNFDQLGLYYAQKPWPKSLGKTQPSLSVNTINDPTFSTDQIAIAEKFPDLVTRVGKSKHHVVKTTFHKNFKAKQQKGRRIPINLQDRVEQELQKLTKKATLLN